MHSRFLSVHFGVEEFRLLCELVGELGAEMFKSFHFFVPSRDSLTLRLGKPTNSRIKMPLSAVII